MSKAKVLWLLASGLVVVVAAVTLAWPLLRRDLTLRGLTVDPATPAPDFTLTDQAGQPFHLAGQKAGATAIFFGYTFCPDVCPGALAEMKQVKKALGTRADRVQFIFITVDPERDHPARMKEFVSRFDPEFIGLTGTPEQIGQVVRDYGVVAEKEMVPGTAAWYLMAHSTLVYLIDADHRLRAKLPYGMGVEDLLHDLRLVLERPDQIRPSATVVRYEPKAGTAEVPLSRPLPAGPAIKVEGVWARPASGAMSPPATGAMSPPATGAMTPPATGAMSPPATGAMSPPATGAMPAPAAGAMPMPAGTMGAMGGTEGTMSGTTSAIYLTLTNDGPTADALVAVRSDVARVIELHETRIVDNVMSMRPVPRIEVPAAGSVQLQRGGLHVMLMGLQRNLAAGDRFTATLVLEGAGEITVDVEVREP